MRWHALAVVLVPGLTAMPAAQVGEPLPDVKLADFTGTKARSLDDFSGRLLLLEYFAFW
jgi:hypothetical protein